MYFFNTRRTIDAIPSDPIWFGRDTDAKNAEVIVTIEYVGTREKWHFKHSKMAVRGVTQTSYKIQNDYFDDHFRVCFGLYNFIHFYPI